MKVEIRDREALESLSLVSLLSYLKSHEWIDDGPWGRGLANLYLKEHSGRTYDIIVPIRDTLPDYAQAMSEAVEAIAAVEERSELDVFYDLAGTEADVIRMSAPNGFSRGALSLRQNADMLNDAYRMLASAARAAEKPRAAYRGGLSAEVAEYLDSVQPMPSYYAGYSLTLRSPVPAGVGQSDMGDDYYSPFPRRATHKLALALTHASTAIDEALVGDSLEPFEKAVDYGVSANLCDSVAGLAKKGHGVEIDLSWAEVRPSNVEDSKFKFSDKSADVLTEAAKSFRRNEPSFDERIIAHIIHLDRWPDEFDGRAVLSSMQEGRLVRIRAEFEQSVYDRVIQAFQEQRAIGLDGDVHPVGNAYELRNPRNLNLMAD
ncbi:MAG: hypothetical protein OXC95_05220 [Dehalococcoidia bacterium]|nr:hypothetical protein [Dehalococcoidia bacterium]